MQIVFEYSFETGKLLFGLILKDTFFVKEVEEQADQEVEHTDEESIGLGRTYGLICCEKVPVSLRGHKFHQQQPA